ncbi:bifunctional UDP-N-acetylglucosamine diphosphorylase/glucosamine-1-phosphate N-acetyltransferase GlmU [Cocleimonas sp. KMM 6892]|uniref:bifunctional UDP-N-acetylglucosamine diphosphorylase/glucosamine-1-phosphate N-acetyltransferase GlmU n=1 Tax=unclassified Cocleimonas TaxID=2639732 RepID=UPI002DB9D945|nr:MULTISPECIES: bifunctional UDP-N-acetylglucosamine diphosphorylase/glucosamine-1-phosphate N-acetyltransferase GlmU [unclassified Cocleimonas]MEB8432401.1 bifunctional UDP-N-acetylglucosamine diphosphorylase/glucosamine-1-phosphate N-acetyltransferase GlmU [Cocleimonas sp. KMM 6892]MEC4715260.1 bifunctional UDP-N-acetylglucosamine diphosphorylase/glucosamine-1-phosphate N-acetyltransferase GlmU [Cocleimonas sp. KMM 6895]MEC4745121.1 bifunctional UDP-N-acetylglucosamine diphosphorylase/glucosa
MKLLPIILAAGQGSRMNSSLPKVLHPIGGKTMLQHVIDSSRKLDYEKLVIIYGHGGELVKQATDASDISWVLQAEQKGTGHAVLQAEDTISDDNIVVIAYGDVPLIKPETLNNLVSKLTNSVLSVLTTKLDNPVGYGRIIRDENGAIKAIVEEKDASENEKRVTEVNTGFIAARGKDLKRWLNQIKPNNNQAEYYLTDCIALAVSEGGLVEAAICEDPFEVQGVNNRIQQAQLERAYQEGKAQELMLEGVTLADPSRIDVRGEMSVGQDVFIDVNNVFIGNNVIGDKVTIHAGCVIENATIGSNTEIHANTVIESANIGNGCSVGPFARVRPNTVLSDEAKIGNFVEIKKSNIGKGSKVSHLSYIGDTVMGDNVNIGAGTITCNYDGVNKFQTTIGDDVFIGSDSQLVAPVTVANGSTIGAGSTITKNTPEGELTLSRSKQLTLKGWQRPTKNK